MSFSNPTKFDEFIELLFCHGFLHFHYKKFVNYIDLKGDETVLDLGCGGGSSSKFIIKKLTCNGTLICNDISSIWIKKCKKRLKKNNQIDYVHDDLTIFDRLESQNIDAIYIHYVLHDLSTKKQNDIVRYLSQKLIYNGHICVNEPTKLTHGMRVKQIRDLMNQCGLFEVKSEILKSSYTGLFKKRK